ncbi:MAG TPA: 16S rRNA (cytidine(1402)-2'-O)-methyltransferase [Candidatus Deferrimicrobium sp.]|nr:16S rRNA (cytidine(1402)-2'-O)-methyltransferase [Candidatus Deferrimicrobium sp.]
MDGTLFLCATPIGNLRDISIRAVEILKAVPLIAAEDTRQTLKLLNHFEIKTKLTSYHQHNEKSKSVELIEHLKLGKDLALVSDAGLPGISDPGEVIVKEAIKQGIKVDVIPGPTAFVSGLVISGLPTSPIYFGGFLPNSSKARQEELKKLKNLIATQIFYESPHRLDKFLADVLDVRGNTTEVVIARELTKLHQELLRGSVGELIERISKTPLKGEMVIYLAPPVLEELDKPADWNIEVDALLGTGLDRKQAIKALADKYGVQKREIYNAVMKNE